METETGPGVSSGVPSPGPTVDEAEFLQQQVSEAKAALAATLSDAAAALKDGVDPATWARRFPLLAIGSALLAGFAAAAVTIPSKEQQELRKLEKLARALRPAAPASNGEKTSAAPSPGPAEPAAKPLWLTILREAINLLRPALVSMLSAYVGSHAGATPPTPNDGHPGHDGSPSGTAAS